MIEEERKYLGKGWNYPIKMDARGQIKLASGAEDVEQAIRIILMTSPGERVMRPDFGCRAKEMVFENLSPETFLIVSESVREALIMWEPRITVNNVTAEMEDGLPGAIICKIEYEINATHDSRSIVYPFYIEKEPEVD